MNFKEQDEEQKLLLKKNERGEYIKVTAVRNKGKKELDSIDIRTMYTKENGEIAFSQKGVKIKVEQAPEVLQAMLGCLDEDEILEIFKELTGEKEEKGA